MFLYNIKAVSFEIPNKQKNAALIKSRTAHFFIYLSNYGFRNLPNYFHLSHILCGKSTLFKKEIQIINMIKAG